MEKAAADHGNAKYVGQNKEESKERGWSMNFITDLLALRGLIGLQPMSLVQMTESFLTYLSDPIAHSLQVLLTLMTSHKFSLSWADGIMNSMKNMLMFTHGD